MPLYLLILNAVAFVLMLVDKRRAQKKQWRISEKALLLTAILGGSLGSLLGMKLFHHKTRKMPFSVGIPVILAVQFIGVAVLYTIVK